MSDALSRHATPGATPQTEQAKPHQVKNNAGGYSFKVSDSARLNRFLTLGTEGGTYYVTERKLTRDNAKFVATLAENNAPFLVNETVAVSEAGRAPRNNPALFAMAAAAGLGSTEYRARALELLPRVARTGSHFETWVKYVEMFRGWGPQLVKGARNWYLNQETDNLAYQLLKYKQRDGWAHRDILRLCAFKGAGSKVDPQHERLFNYVLKGEKTGELPALIDLTERAHGTRNVKDWKTLIGQSRSLSWEMLPSEALAEADVWRALVDNGNLPLGAFLRNLSRMTRLGVLKQMDPWTAEALGKLTSQENLLKARIHPINVLIALRTYAMGRSFRGTSTWTPVQQVIDALDSAFYLAFGNVQASGKRTLIGVDVSGSMGGIAGDTGLTHSTIAGAMSLITMKTEPSYAIMAFDQGLRELPVSPRQRLDDVVRAMSNINWGGTDCSLPMIWAMQTNTAVDTFQVYTDNETWAGQMHPHEALKKYRQKTGIDAKLQVIASAATDFTIADPLDSGMLDVAGFDSAVPNLLANHARGEL